MNEENNQQNTGEQTPNNQPQVVGPQSQQSAPQQPQTLQHLQQPQSLNQMSQPYTQQGSSKSGKKLIIIVTTALLLIGGGVAAFAILGGSNSSESTPDNNSVSESEVDPQETLENQDITGTLGEEVKLSNGVSITVTGFERNWTATKEGRTVSEPKSGTNHTAVNITVVNNTPESIRLGGTDFTLFDQAGEDYIESYTNYQADETVITLGEIAPGETRTGQIIYPSVPNNSTLTFIYEEGYKNYGTGEELTVKATWKE